MGLVLSESETARLQEIFLSAYLEYCEFTAACNVLETLLEKDGIKWKAQTLAGMWLVTDEKFKERYTESTLIVNMVRYEKAVDFLNRCGHGKQKTGKETQIYDANIKAAHMLCDAYNPEMWSSKKPVEGKKKKDKPTRIEYASHAGRVSKEKDVNSDNGAG
jgi:hypothetical protein